MFRSKYMFYVRERIQKLEKPDQKFGLQQTEPYLSPNQPQLTKFRKPSCRNWC